jgi:hypothetical protein
MINGISTSRKGTEGNVRPQGLGTEGKEQPRQKQQLEAKISGIRF